MEQTFNLLLDSRFGQILLGAVITAIITVLLSEVSRSYRVKRLLLESAKLPSFLLTWKGGQVKIRIVGSYRIVNMSDLPISVCRINILGYNLASRAFQFKLWPHTESFRDTMSEIPVPPRGELNLVSEDSCDVYVERFQVRKVPRYLWLETLEEVRLASRTRSRYCAHLYASRWRLPEKGEVMYDPTWIEVGAQKARILALPGKLLFRRREKRSQKSTPGQGPGESER